MRRRKINWPSCIACDCETTGLNLHGNDRAFAVSMLDDQGNEFYWEWPVDPFTREVRYSTKDLRTISKVLQDYDNWIFHNTKFDIRALEKAGIDVESHDWRTKFQDTVLCSHVCCSNEPHDLKWIGEHYFDIPTDDEKELKDLVKKCRRAAKKMGWNLGEKVEQDYWLPSAINLHTDDCAFIDDNGPCKTYAMTDVKRTMYAWMMYRELMKKEKLWDNYERERKLLPVVYDMENRGVTIHPKKLDSEIKRYRAMASSLEKKCKAVAASKGYEDINIDSNAQVGKLLHTDKKGFRLPVVEWTNSQDNPQPKLSSSPGGSIEKLLETTTGKPLEFLSSFSSRKKANTAAKYLAGYKERRISYEDCCKLHGSYNQTGTDTTRFSASNPNPTNIGSGKKNEDGDLDYQLRSVFGPIPKERIWYCADYQQLQLRIIAYDSNDKAMIKAFEEGYSFHDYMAIRIYNCEVEDITKEMKRVAKAVNFGFSFGAGEKKIDGGTGITGLYQTVRKMFPNAFKYMEANIEFAKEHGYIETMGGYRLYIDPKRIYIATNYRVQGTEGDIVKNAMIEVDEYLQSLGKDHYMTLMVHDELDFDFPLTTIKKHNRYLKAIAGIMQGAGEALGVITPVNIEVCRSHWADTEKIVL